MNRIHENENNLPAQETLWEDALEDHLIDLNEWLLDPINVHDAIAAVEEMLLEKHFDYGEDNLNDFGELGILVRVSDKVARLKNLVGRDGKVKDESRADTWRDLAGYAIQALILMKRIKCTANIENVFEIRKNRLIRGFCPDCGEGVLLRRSAGDGELYCSKRCGYRIDDIYGERMIFPDFSDLLNWLASQKAQSVQK